MSLRHGDTHFSIKGKIIIATLTGAYNKNGAIQYTEGIKSIVKSFKGERYAILVDNTDMEGGTPEAYQVLEEYNQWLNNTNLVAKAIVSNTTITTDIIKSLSPSINLQKNMHFEDKETAMTWVKKILS